MSGITFAFIGQSIHDNTKTAVTDRAFVKSIQRTNKTSTINTKSWLTDLKGDKKSLFIFGSYLVMRSAPDHLRSAK